MTAAAPVGGGESPVARWRKHLRTSAWPALVVGLLVLGGSISYLVLPATVEQKVVLGPRELLTRGQGPATMPALSGMSIEAATIALQDAGVDVAALKTITNPAAGTPGTVLAQDPEPGVGVQGTVFLTVSESTSTPKLSGLDYRAAQDKVEALGGVVRLEQVVAPDRTVGTVLRTVPQAGKSMTAVTVLYVADPGTPVPLANISSTDESGCGGSGTATAGGASFSTAVACSLYDGEESYATYATAGVTGSFSTKVAFDDGYGVGRATVRILLDGKLVDSITITGGAPKAINVPITGHSTLKIVVLGAPDADQGSSVILGDASFNTLPEQADLLTGTP